MLLTSPATAILSALGATIALLYNGQSEEKSKRFRMEIATTLRQLHVPLDQQINHASLLKHTTAT